MGNFTEWNQLPVIMNTKEVAKVLGYGPDVVRGLCRVGKIPNIRLGRAFMIPRDILKDWVDQLALKQINV